MTAPSGDPMVGRTIAHYDILARAGGGGMGVVYKARDTKLGRTVALKFLPQQWSGDEDARQRFLREAQAASATHHPNICTIHDIDASDDGQLFIVMAYYEGQTLKQRLASGPLPIDEALDVATQIADGLAKAHGQGVVHRDVKPGNVMLTEDGVRILDFGLATFADALKITAENATLGTAAYMSPEQVRGQAADARSDVWAAGVILYEMLAGHVPFRGSHGEAIAYAIRNESPEPLRAVRPEIPESVEQIVFRAMHKEPAVRYPSGRDLARALRQVRGHSLPPDLRTETVQVSAVGPREPARTRARRGIAALAVAAAAIALAFIWVLWPVERIPAAIVPVVNQTGYSELDAFRPGLTLALTRALADSRGLRLVGHDQMRSILAGVRARGEEISSGEALQAIRAGTGAQTLIVVTLVNLNDGSGFRARVDFRRAETLTSEGDPFETPSEVSALVKETAYRLIVPAAAGIEERFRARGPLRGRLAHVLRRLLGREASPALPASTLDAAAALEQGMEAFEALEYEPAFRSFSAAADLDALNPVIAAWQSRAARAMRRDADGERLARQAGALLSEDTPPADRLFVEAVAAEARREADAAARYTAMYERRPDDASLLLELGAFQDRQGLNTEAIGTYHRALERDGQLLRPHLELCRLYNRVNEPVNAREHGRRAVDGFRALGAGGPQAQALFCLTDSLRVGDDRERADAVRHAAEALEIVQRLQLSYNLPRAYNYVALAEEAQGRLVDAARRWEQALAAARAAGNGVIEPLVLMNLGATHEKLGNRAQAIDYLRQSSRRFEALGDQGRAAENMFNVGVILVTYGGDAEEGLRNIRTALSVFRELGNRSFEVRAAHVMSTHHRYAGRYTDAERELNRARSLASERDLDFGSTITSIRLAQARFDTADYERARTLLADALAAASGRGRLEAQIHLARTYVRLGDRASAAQLLADADTALSAAPDPGLMPLLYLARGELADESGRTTEARDYFGRGAALLEADLPDVDALEAQVGVGRMEAAAGNHERARRIASESLDIARRVGHLSLEARCRILLARIEVSRGRFEGARRELDAVARDEGSRALERELRAQALYWSARTWTGLGDAARAAADRAAARDVVNGIAAGMTEQRRAAFLSRPGVAAMAGR